MRTGVIRGLLAAALVAVLVTAARAADDDDDAPAPSGISAWWNSMFGDPPKPPPKAEKPKKPAPPPKERLATPMEREAFLRREKEDYFRRLKVCLRLREIALQKNDEAFLDQIDVLEKNIDDLYMQRTAHLGQAPVGDDAASVDKPKRFGPHANTRTQNTTEDDQ